MTTPDVPPTPTVAPDHSTMSSPYARKYANNRVPRVQGISIYRPFVYGSIAKLFDPANRPAGINPDHTHQWSVYVRGVDGEDISYWLRKVQFKLHETYPNSLRTIEAPPFEVTETGWGEFEVQIKMYFVPEAAEKPQTIWHFLRLHPWEGDVEAKKARREVVGSQSYEEILFNEPTETLFEVMTSGPPRGKSKGKGGLKRGERTAELPVGDTPDNPFSQRAEGAEIDRLREAKKTVERLIGEERGKLAERERVMAELNKK
ncbi:hypothetical protein G7Y79_00008g024190 [Physcia stellaris]|nr:hypothetical protein G7Y79_00008g024190 [Physcia stellaris]